MHSRVHASPSGGSPPAPPRETAAPEPSVHSDARPPPTRTVRATRHARPALPPKPSTAMEASSPSKAATGTVTVAEPSSRFLTIHPWMAIVIAVVVVVVLIVVGVVLVNFQHNIDKLRKDVVARPHQDDVTLIVTRTCEPMVQEMRASIQRMEAYFAHAKTPLASQVASAVSAASVTSAASVASAEGAEGAEGDVSIRAAVAATNESQPPSPPLDENAGVGVSVATRPLPSPSPSPSPSIFRAPREPEDEGVEEGKLNA